MRTHYTTSYTPVEDRFEFSRTGHFRCRYRFEAIYSFGAAEAFIILTIIIYAIRPPHNSLAWYVFNWLRILEPPAAVLLCIGIIRVILMGQEYKFTADTEKMLIICPAAGIRYDIFFDKVKNVAYSGYYLFGKMRGFHVTVTCDRQTFKFDFVFPSNGIKHEDFTPFRIIEERSGLLEKPEYIAGQRIDNIINEEFLNIRKGRKK